MSEHEELSKKLLAENGLGDGELRSTGRAGLQAIIEAEGRRSAQLRNVMLVAWAAFVATLVVVGVLFLAAEGTEATVQVGGGTMNVVAAFGLLAWILAPITFIIAVVATLAWGLRMAFGPRGVDERLARIEEQLARLEAEHAQEAGTGPRQ